MSLTVESTVDPALRAPAREMRGAGMPGVVVVARSPVAGLRTGRASGDARGRVSGLAIWALSLLLLLFLAIPVGSLLVRALGTDDAWDARTFDTLRQALGLSIATTAVTMVIVIALGTPLAYLLA